MTTPAALRIHPTDTVAVAIRPLAEGEEVVIDGRRVVARQNVAPGHKLALHRHGAGQKVIKYGFSIGTTTAPIETGDWVHSHNLTTGLVGLTEHHYAPTPPPRIPSAAMPAFKGYRRSSGRVGTRNEIWVLNTVGCVNHAAERIARLTTERFAGTIDGVYAFGHPFGCSQLGDDLEHTQRVLAGLMRNPNAGGVLVLGLGCESNQMEALLEHAGDIDRHRLRFFNTQDVIDELEQGTAEVSELVAVVSRDERVECPASDLVLGHKCGGSDGFSGISANAVVGRIADRLTALGGCVLLSEVPEMFGAEEALLNRAADDGVFRDAAAMIDDFKQYFLDHGQTIYENPSPGNIAGGLTTLEEKSFGAIQKGGQASVTDVLRYGDPVKREGLSLVESPGNDGVSSTALIASGATMVLFTTGRGTPLGFPVPTVKIASNTDIAVKKPHWIDFNAGALLDGTASIDELADGLFAFVLDVASGRLTNNEKNGYREIAIWKGGVTL
ncbi:MAG TPA: altronate dehydratase family protein [Gemmatimonadaceae bacterium]